MRGNCIAVALSGREAGLAVEFAAGLVVRLVQPAVNNAAADSADAAHSDLNTLLLALKVKRVSTSLCGTKVIGWLYMMAAVKGRRTGERNGNALRRTLADHHSENFKI
jgi:chemotaxis receptor (MCP) glutamine deamidase CheD